MTLQLKCGMPFRVFIEGRVPGRTAVTVRVPRLITDEEAAEIDRLIVKHVFHGHATAAGLVHEEDPAKLKAMTQAFLDQSVERN